MCNVFLFALILTACQPASSTKSPFLEKPNIIFILTDDQRWDSVGFMGNEIVHTPNLDRLADVAHVFKNAFVTSAICTPSRACYMLGQYERKHGINFNSGTSMSSDAWSQSYPAILKAHGYFTGYIGKNHLPIGEQGYYTGLMEQTFDYWYAGHHHLSFYPKRQHKIFDSSETDTQTEVLQEGILAFLTPDSNAAFMQSAKKFVSQRPGGQPFCLSICLNLPHGSSTSTMEQLPSDDALYRTAYRELQDTLPLPPHYLAKEDIDDPKLPADVLLTQLRQTGYDWVNQTESVRERTIRTYQTISGIDRMVGKLREQLESAGLAENTIIIFSSDHGLFFGEHGLGGKSLCYETNLRVPMLIYDPRLKQGGRIEELALSIDVAPTILSLAGIEIPDTMQGSDLTSLMRGGDVVWRDAAFGENLWSTIFGNPRCETVRTAEYRYIRYFKNDNLEKRRNTPPDQLYTVSAETSDTYHEWLTASIHGEPPVYEELFHITEDPYEETNLADRPAYAEILNELRSRCNELVREAKGDIDLPPSTIRVEPRWTKTNYRQTK
ncbi:MAG: sulfatase-like hydrolase/transferase [Verrucomicrobiota bacterium]